MVNFTFTRNPSVKVAAEIQASGLVSADNTLVLIGALAASGAAATVNTPISINNYGDPVAALSEVNTAFGAGSQLGEMVIAAINGVLYSNIESKLFPPIVCIPMPSGAVASDLVTALQANLNYPMPYVAIGFDATATGVLTAVKNHVTAINANDRGDNGQFGSFAFIATEADTSTATPLGTTAGVEGIVIPWLRDLATTKANKVHAIASALAAISAAAGVPYNPLDGLIVGGLVPPSQTSDYLTPGDAGSVVLGLAAGLSPLIVSQGAVKISRMITTRVTVLGVQDPSYYDIQDWQVLYYLRKNAYVLAQLPRYKRAKASIVVLQSLKSELLQTCKVMEDLGMLQYVDRLAPQFTVARVPSNRHAAVFTVPVNIIPGFHNKGIDLIAGTQFDVVIA